MQINNSDEKKNIYRVGRITVLELMTVLAVLGVLLTWVLQHFLA